MILAEAKTIMDFSKIKILAFDLDDTLLDDKKQVTEATKKALLDAYDKGYILVISTGRALSAVSPEALALGIFSYAVTSNGSRVVDLKTGETIYKNCLTREALEPAMPYVSDPELMREVFYNGRVYDEQYCLDHFEQYGITNKAMQYYIRSSRDVCDNTLDFIEEHFGELETVTMFFSDLDKRDRYYEELKKITSVTTVISLVNNIEIVANGSSKGNGLKMLSEILGYGLENVMAFGDNDNDSTMIEAAGIGVAMGNATEGLKAIADVVTLKHTEDGVAYMLRKML